MTDLKLDLELLGQLKEDLESVVMEFKNADDFSDSVADATGVVIERYSYDPWGQPVIEPPDGPMVFGSCRVRSGLIFCQLKPSLVVTHKCCDPT